jgi:hypothetical protein
VISSKIGRCAFCFSFVGAMVVSQLVYAAPADLNLGMVTFDRIIRGAQIPVYADVYNSAAPGSDDLNYTLYYTLPDGSTTTVVNGTRAADGGADATRWVYNFNSAGAPYGDNNFSATAAGQAGTLHSPKTVQADVEVLNHVVPATWINGREVDIREDHPQEPSVDPLAFGATGGGEFVSLAAPNIIGDPLVPTANMDLDSVFPTGSTKITATLAATYNVVANDDPSAGIPWQITIDTRSPGHFETIFNLGFSDEDIPGGSPTGSVKAKLRVFADVDASGAVTGGLVPLYVPEPGVAPMAVCLSGLLLRRRRS